MVRVYELASPTSPYPESIHGFLKEVIFGAGDVIHRMGERYREMYLIAEGWAEVRPKREGCAEKPTELGPGSVIGEMGYLQGFPAPADIVTRTAVRALVKVFQGALQNLDKGPNWVRRIRMTPVFLWQV